MTADGGATWTVEGFDDLREIGRGGSSVVYRARQVAFDRPVALKVVDGVLADAGARRRFERECAALGALADVDGVVPVHAVAYTSDGRGCIVMRLMAESLADRVRRTGPMAPAEVREIGVTVARALAAAHALGIVHRDVKPGNVLVDDTGAVAIGDFDIAAGSTLAASTRTRDALSPPHSPPERLSGEDDGDAAGDVWSLGSTLYSLLAGHPPFGDVGSDGGMAGLIHRVLHEPVPPIERPDVDEALESALAHAMAKRPSDRWPGMAEFGTALASPGVDRIATPARAAPTGRSATGRGGLLVVGASVASAVVAALLIAFL